MAVANSQISEILNVVCRYVPADKRRMMLMELTSTVAYERNASYRETIDKLIHYLAVRKRGR